MRVLLAPSDPGWVLRGVESGKTLIGDDVSRLEREGPRWVWSSTAAVYPALLRQGIRVARCHDLALTRALLNAHAGHWSPPEPTATQSPAGSHVQDSLFSTLPQTPPPPAAVLSAASAASPTAAAPTASPTAAAPAASPTAAAPAASPTAATPAASPTAAAPPEAASPTAAAPAASPTAAAPPEAASPSLDALAAELQAQEAEIQAVTEVSPGFRLLVAAESAAALAAAEMGRAGLPWRGDVHDEILTGLLGERPRHNGRPPKLQALAVEVCTLLDDPQLNPDSPAEVLKAFRRQGVPLQTTRAWELKKVEHPAVAPLLRYKELARLHTAHGWAWRETWVHEGRFRPEYLVGGVVSGRWAARGGGALQIPRPMRAAVVADPGWRLVVADAGQLEPRLLAALSDDPGMVKATQAGDLYTDIAQQALGRPDARADAKIGLLAAMYGGGHQSPAMAALRRRFPRALALLESAARTGEEGGVVRSVLGRTSPPAPDGWAEAPEAAARARGRFTRNFVIQASAADWANVLVAELRRRLTPLAPAELVFFQHDEVMVHTPAELAPAVIEAITEAGQEATRLVVGDRGVRIPLTGQAVTTYADKP